MEMQKYILKIINSQPLVKMSWGFDDLSAIEDGIKFSVHGFLHKGFVEIAYCECSDLFEVRIINEDLSLREKIEDVFLGELVSTIDSRVECETNSTYYEQVMQYMFADE